MPSPSTSVVIPRVFERVLQISRGTSDPRGFATPTHIGMRVETAEYGPVDVSLQHDRAGVPEKFMVHGASIGIDEQVPLGAMTPDGIVTSNTVSYREGGSSLGALRYASLADIMSAVSEAIK